ncbi:hypothetical protein [Mucilaginibacter lacusdianchii]|uniref:hypothetical protein n=1 Tax=Mucilaginibacter lacusdianchii TaxID=2684211 RepID=UPI00131EA467|nr:hypothetical protein [Mucilaginibacter sp. JXJ CY 39]
MKPFSLMWLLIIVSSTVYSQTLLIRGRLQPGRSTGMSSVVVNDTLYKTHYKSFLNGDQFAQLRKTLIKDSLLFEPDSTGAFYIRAKLKDTLYFYCLNYVTKKYAVADLLKRRNILIRLKEVPCIKYKLCKDTVPRKTYVFLGEKVTLKALPDPRYCEVNGVLRIGMDAVYLATYHIIKNIYGKYKKKYNNV